MPLEDNETWIHPIKAIMVKKYKPGVPRPEEVYDSGNEPSNEDELKAYRSRFGILVGTQGEAEQSSTQPTPPPPISTILRGGPGQSFHYTRGPGTLPDHLI